MTTHGRPPSRNGIDDYGTTRAIPGATEPDRVELARFREEWKAEVRNRKKPPDPVALSTTNAQPRFPPFSPKHVSTSAGAIPSGKVHVNITAPSQSLQSAVQIYREAIQREQNAELDDALQLYRQAFRMDPHVDRAYAREEKLTIALSSQPLPPRRDLVISQVNSQSEKVSTSGVLSRSTQTIAVSILAQIISTFPSDIQFQPEDEKQPIWLRTLPDELLVFILRRLDITSIERFAIVCRKARLLSLDATLWRELVVTTYKPPQITHAEHLMTLMNRYTFNYRRLFIEHPRLRLDGVYIAICHYVRPGLSENHWVNAILFQWVSSLSLLTNDEKSPQQVIPLLKPTLRMKGLYLGTWQLFDNTVHLNLVDANDRLPESLPSSFSSLISMLERLEVSDVPHHSHKQPTIHNHATNQLRTRYMFVMRLDLRSRPLGRWNRLEIESYNSVHLESGDMTPVALKHERPFWFSKVRSY